MISTIIESKSGEPPRSTAYYYADLEKYHQKKNEDLQPPKFHTQKTPQKKICANTKTTTEDNDLSEYVEVNEVINNGAIREVPPFRDRLSPEYNIPLNTPGYSSQVPGNHERKDTHSNNSLKTSAISPNVPGNHERNIQFNRTFPSPRLPEYQERKEIYLNTQGISELPGYIEREDSTAKTFPSNLPGIHDRKDTSTPGYTTFLPEYHERKEVFSPSFTPNPPGYHERKDTYSTAGTFRMQEPKDKEPLLAELEIVGRIPLSQLESSTSSGVRRSRSWYFCCPNVGDDEISRDSSWRYSSLRPVTAPPMPGQNGLVLATQSTGQEDVASLKAERDALALALANERQRAASAARATDARLAELHGVIAELVRRRAADKSAIVEESDECESTTQPAGEADQSKTDQNDSSSILSPEESPQEDRHEVEDTYTDTSTPDIRQEGGEGWWSSDCDKEHEAMGCLHPPTKGRCGSRQAKMASRVRLRKTDEESKKQDESWCLEACEKLALDMCAQADIREAMAAATSDGSPLSVCLSRLCSARAELCVMSRALARATHTAHRLSSWCGQLESCCSCVCEALRAADRAIELYDVLLALAETSHGDPDQRRAAEQVACQVLERLESESPRVGDRMVSPGPWQMHRGEQSQLQWSENVEKELRSRAAQLKADTVRLRNLAPEPRFFSYYDPEEDDLADSVNNINIAEMEAAVMVQEVMSSREAAALARLKETQSQDEPVTECNNTSSTNHKTNSNKKRREPAWLDACAAETDL